MMIKNCVLLPLVWMVGFACANSAIAAASDYFVIQVVDEATERGVPLIELKTVNSAAWWTDSNGIVAFNEPGLMDTEVYFHIESPGYEYPIDVFKNRGVKLKPRRGGHATIRIKRLNIAERLYRITGQGIYRDSILTGHGVPLKQPVLNGQVMGQDTVIATPYRGRIYWFWGDTDRPSYPLGNFGASGATSEWPGRGGLDPSKGIDLTYFVDAPGFAKVMCPLPKGGLHWIESVLTVPDEHGNERLVARMANVPGLARATDWHLLLFNDQKQVFESIQDWNIHEHHVSAHPFRARIGNANYQYIFPHYRVPADLKSLADLNRYEAFTCVAGSGKLEGDETKLDRDSTGRIHYSWKAGADPHYESDLIRAGKLKAEESWHYLLDYETGKPLTRQLESVAWNEFRHRWIAFFADKSGEVWFGEADTPLGPWGYGRRIVTHGNYNFYNIAYHPFFDQQGGRLAYFEGTYTAAFSDAKQKTPRYDYNQLMYRVALDDPRLTLPVAVYRLRETNGITWFCTRETIEARNVWRQIEEVAWFAMPPDVRQENFVSVYFNPATGALSVKATGGAPPLFCGLPISELEANAETRAGRGRPDLRSQDLVVLRQYKRISSERFEYSTGAEAPPDCEPIGRPLCLVWKVPGNTFVLDWEAKPVPNAFK
jgi:hypothetical protein